MTTDVDRALANGSFNPGLKDGNLTEVPSREFLLESKDAPTIAGILFVTILTSVIVLGRILARTFIVRRYGYDDALAVVSLVRWDVGPPFNKPLEAQHDLHKEPLSSFRGSQRLTNLGLFDCLYLPMHSPHQPWIWPPLRLHPICPARGRRHIDRSPRFRRPHNLHDDTFAVPRLWSCLLPSHLRHAQGLLDIHLRCRRIPRRRLLAATLSHHFPLPACYGIVAV